MSFTSHTSIITYSPSDFKWDKITSLDEIVLNNNPESISWVNTYGINFTSEVKSVIIKNNLDDFLVKLMADTDHPNKVLVLDEMLFLALKILKFDNNGFHTEQMFFISGTGYVWSIQEIKGDYFHPIRERLKNNTGIVRSKQADYLLFLIIECIIDNYQETFDRYAEDKTISLDPLKMKPTPEFASIIENRKKDFFRFKKAATGLRELLTKLEKAELKGTKNKYFNELKEQTNYLIDDIDFELQQLESSINLIFSMQGHLLNEVMKTLTIFSVVFIPLTFLAGIYGMNFEYMPELKVRYGYFILLGVMALIGLISFWIIKKRRWF